MRGSTPKIPSADAGDQAFSRLCKTANLPEAAGFSNSFVPPSGQGGPEKAVAAATQASQVAAGKLKLTPEDLNPLPPGLDSMPALFPSQPADLGEAQPISRLPESVLAQIQPDQTHDFKPTDILSSEAFQKAPQAVRDETRDAFDRVAADRGSDVLNEAQAYSLNGILQRDDVKSEFGGFRLPVSTPNPSDVFQQVTGANTALFQMPSPPGSTPGFAGPIGGVGGGSAGGGFPDASQAATTVLGAAMDAGFGTANSAQLASELANLLPPEAAKAVQTAIALGPSLQNIAEKGLDPSNAADVIGQLGNAMGVPYLGQAAAMAKKYFDNPDGMKSALSDPSALADMALDQLVGFLPPMAQAAIAQAKAIAGALKDLLASPTGGIPIGMPGIFVEKQMIATVLTAPTTHGIPLMPGPGCITVHALMMPVWRVGMDIHICPIPIPPAPHGPGIVPLGALRTFAEFGPIARHGDMVLEVIPSNIIPMMTVGGGGDDDDDPDHDDPPDIDDDPVIGDEEPPDDPAESSDDSDENGKEDNADDKAPDRSANADDPRTKIKPYSGPGEDKPFDDPSVTKDGGVYCVMPGGAQCPFDGRYQAVQNDAIAMTNGMSNPDLPGTLDVAQNLANKTGKPVVLVYNQDTSSPTYDPLHLANLGDVILGKMGYSDPAAVSLSDLIDHSGGQITIDSHSQGTINATNAINSSVAKGFDPTGIYMTTNGNALSSMPLWGGLPDGVNVVHNVHTSEANVQVLGTTIAATADPVTAFFGTDKGSNVNFVPGDGIAHGYNTYINNSNTIRVNPPSDARRTVYPTESEFNSAGSGGSSGSSGSW